MAGTHRNDKQVKGFALDPQAAFEKLRQRELKKPAKLGDVLQLLGQLENSLMGKVMFFAEKLGVNDADYEAWFKAKQAEAKVAAEPVSAVAEVYAESGPLDGGIGIGGGE